MGSARIRLRRRLRWGETAGTAQGNEVLGTVLNAARRIVKARVGGPSAPTRVGTVGRWIVWGGRTGGICVRIGIGLEEVDICCRWNPLVCKPLCNCIICYFFFYLCIWVNAYLPIPRLLIWSASLLMMDLVLRRYVFKCSGAWGWLGFSFSMFGCL